MIKRGPGTGYKSGKHHHRCKHSPDKVEVARMLADFGWGDICIGELLNASKNSVRDWRAYRTRAQG